MKKIVLLISLFISLSTIAQNELDTMVKSKINLYKPLYQEEQLFIINGKISTKKGYNKIDISIIKSIDTIIYSITCNGVAKNVIIIKTKKELRKEKRKANRKKKK